MKQILSHSDLAELLENEPIEALVYQSEGCYSLFTDSFVVDIYLHYSPPSRMGPREFNIEFGDLHQRS